MKPDSTNELSSSQKLDEESVSKYLLENPDFFNQRSDLLLALTIPHGSGGAISLLEKQISLFRERNRELQNNINDFIFNAEENDALFEKTRIIILELLKSDSLEDLSLVVKNTLKTEFSAHVSSLLFITDSETAGEDINTLPVAKTKETLGKLFEKKRTFCCELSPEQAILLFPKTQKEILSAAVIPIHPGEALHDENSFNKPILVIGSEKHNHFNSSLDTLFLDFIGEIIAAHITRLVG